MRILSGKQFWFYSLTLLIIALSASSAIFLHDERNRIILFGQKSIPSNKRLLGVEVNMTELEALRELARRNIIYSVHNRGDFICEVDDDESYSAIYLLEDNSWRRGIGCMFFQNGRLARMDYGSSFLDL